MPNSRDPPVVLSSPRLDSPSSPSFPVTRSPRSAAGPFSTLPHHGDADEAREEEEEEEEDDKEWRAETRLLLEDDEELELQLPSSATQQLGALVFSLTATTVQVVASKAVLNAVDTPILFILSSLLVQIALLRSWAWCGYCKLPALSRTALQATSSLVAVNVLVLVLCTIALQSLDLSFYQIARGLTLPFSAFFSRYLMGFPAPSLAVTLSAFVVFGGFLIGALAEPLNEAGAILCAFLGTIMLSLQSVFIRRAHTNLGGQTLPLDVVWYSHVFSAFIIGLLSLFVGEGPFMVELLSPLWSDETQVEGIGSAAAYETAKADLWTFFLGTLVFGLFGFLQSIAGGLSIRVTAAPIQMASTSLRGALLTWLSVVLFADILTPARFFGIILVVFGGIFYIHFKSQAPLLPSSLALHSSPSPYYHPPSNAPLLPTAMGPSSVSLSRPRKPRPLSLSPDTARRPFGSGAVGAERRRSPSPTDSPSPSPKLGARGGVFASQQQGQERGRQAGSMGLGLGTRPRASPPLAVEKRFGESDEEGEEGEVGEEQSEGSEEEAEGFRKW